MSLDHISITIIGAGAVGLACAEALSRAGHDVCVLERHDSFGRETSSRNSEVAHAGLYYPQGSLKSELCIDGIARLYAFCDAYGIAYSKCGKLVVGTTDEEVGKISAIFDNAKACGVRDLRWLTQTEIVAMEPAVSVKAAFFSPHTGYFDTHAYMKALSDLARQNGSDIVFNTEVIALEKGPHGYRVTTRDGSGEEYAFLSEWVINAAGLYADQIARMVGIDCVHQGYQIHFSKGQYFRLTDPSRFGISHLVYPSPTATSLGIHLTPDLGGGVRLGPDAAYCDAIDYAVSPASAEHFYESVRTYLPDLCPNDLVPDTAGIRPKLQAPGEDVRDFIITEESDVGCPGFINLIGIESPGLTASLSIAARVSSCVACGC